MAPWLSLRALGVFRACFSPSTHTGCAQLSQFYPILSWQITKYAKALYSRRGYQIADFYFENRYTQVLFGFKAHSLKSQRSLKTNNYDSAVRQIGVKSGVSRFVHTRLLFAYSSRNNSYYYWMFSYSRLAFRIDWCSEIFFYSYLMREASCVMNIYVDWII